MPLAIIPGVSPNTQLSGTAAARESETHWPPIHHYIKWSSYLKKNSPIYKHLSLVSSIFKTHLLVSARRPFPWNRCRAISASVWNCAVHIGTDSSGIRKEVLQYRGEGWGLIELILFNIPFEISFSDIWFCHQTDTEERLLTSGIFGA